jgi:lipopolysaccharide transport system permease protein
MADQEIVATRNAPSADDEGLTTISPPRDQLSFGLAEFWKYRNLLYLFIWRDIKVRYKQTVLGAAWAVLQPFLTMVVFTLVFGRLAKVPSDGVAYPVFVLSGLLPWQFFAHALLRSGNSLVLERYLLTKVYVPRLIVPVSAVLSGLPDFGVAYTVLLALMFHYGISPARAALTVLPFLLLAVATALCVGLFLSALNVRYHDVGYTVPFFAQLWFFITPVAYSSSLIPQRWRALYELNPMTGVVEGFRWAVLGGQPAPWSMIIASAAGVGVLLLLGLLYFQRMDRTLADVI